MVAGSSSREPKLDTPNGPEGAAVGDALLSVGMAVLEALLLEGEGVSEADVEDEELVEERVVEDVEEFAEEEGAVEELVELASVVEVVDGGGKAAGGGED
ncbi:MAG: hypothetical protein M1837_001946 [Sclerophora amabilis]|nr:MAG: hypothetical protein M1837_001946 [Sclerophora amabilis]